MDSINKYWPYGLGSDTFEIYTQYAIFSPFLRKFYSNILTYTSSPAHFASTRTHKDMNQSCERVPLPAISVFRLIPKQLGGIRACSGHRIHRILRGPKPNGAASCSRFVDTRRYFVDTHFQLNREQQGFEAHNHRLNC